jgi:hypothetical protein
MRTPFSPFRLLGVGGRGSCLLEDGPHERQGEVAVGEVLPKLAPKTAAAACRRSGPYQAALGAFPGKNFVEDAVGLGGRPTPAFLQRQALHLDTP